MSIFNRIGAGFAAVLLTVTVFALPDLARAKAPVTQVAYQGISHVAKAVLVSAIHRASVR
jgi:hypothetical protein